MRLGHGFHFQVVRLSNTEAQIVKDVGCASSRGHTSFYLFCFVVMVVLVFIIGFGEIYLLLVFCSMEILLRRGLDTLLLVVLFYWVLSGGLYFKLDYFGGSLFDQRGLIVDRYPAFMVFSILVFVYCRFVGVVILFFEICGLLWQVVV